LNFRQGDIIEVNFDPTVGHEQGGKRPAVVISRELFCKKTGQVIICPITSKIKPFPTRIELTNSTKTFGFVICDFIKTIDLTTRDVRYIERMDEETLDKVLGIIRSEIRKDFYQL